MRAPKPVVTVVGVGSVGAATVCGLRGAVAVLSTNPSTVVVEPYFTWISAGTITVDASLQLDPLSAVMVAFVTFVGLSIHVYSVGYMHGESDRGYARYFAYLNLFMFAMLLLVLGSNLVVLFVGWEGVGLCSYLLIGFYYTKGWCAAAGSKAFIVNRIGDLGFLIAVFITLAVFGSVEYSRVFAEAAGHPEQYAAAATVIGLLLLRRRHRQVSADPALRLAAGRHGRSDPGVGPDPRRDHGHRRRLHGCAGQCLLPPQPDRDGHRRDRRRRDGIFAATIGLVQNDIKKVLAYSTVSQLGYMFLAAGVGAFVDRHLPRRDPRLLQGLSVPRLGIGDPRL